MTKLREERMLDAAVKTMMAAKLYKIFTTWLILTMHGSDGNSKDGYDEISPPGRTQRRRSSSGDSPSKGGASAGVGGRRHDRTTSSLDMSVDSGAFESPQGVGALSPVQRQRDSASPIRRGLGTLSPVQLLRRHEFDLRSNGLASRTPSPDGTFQLDSGS
jgi:hypothetical protein